MKSVTIRVSDEDHKLFSDVAALEDMPLSMLVRRLLKARAVVVGLSEDLIAHSVAKAEAKIAADVSRNNAAATAQAKPVTPHAEWRPVPQGVNAWRDEVYQRVNRGESIADVAKSYGTPLDDIKGMYRRGKDNAEAHTQQHSTPTPTPTFTPLTYAPVDPDNPTEAETAANAAIARQKMRDMGFDVPEPNA